MRGVSSCVCSQRDFMIVSVFRLLGAGEVLAQSVVSFSQGQVLPSEQLEGERGAKVRVMARKRQVCQAEGKDKRKVGYKQGDRCFKKYKINRLRVSMRLVTCWSAGVRIRELEGEVMLFECLGGGTEVPDSKAQEWLPNCAHWKDLEGLNRWLGPPRVPDSVGEVGPGHFYV